jgi:hypothetical protein
MDVQEYKIHQDPQNRKNSGDHYYLFFGAEGIRQPFGTKMGGDGWWKFIPNPGHVDPGDGHNDEGEQPLK